MKKITLSMIFFVVFSSEIFAMMSVTNGVISNKCDEVLEIVDKFETPMKNDLLKMKDVIISGVTGYLSGMNMMTLYNNDNVKNVMHDEHDYIYAFVLNYCKKNPDKWLIDAADEYFFTLPEYEE